MKHKNKIHGASLGRAFAYFWLTLLAVLAAFPLYWMVVSAFKSPGELSSGSIRLLPKQPTLHYYSRVFNEFGFHRNLLNSLAVALSATLIAIAIASLAAYGIVRYFDRTRKGKAMTRVLILTYMFPTILLAIPSSVIIGSLGLSNTKLGLVLTYLSFSTPFAVWMLIGFFRTVPREVEEAAMVDGASHFRVFYNIALPIAAPGVVATAIYTFINAWNMYMWPLLVTGSDSMRTVQIGIGMLDSVDSQSISMMIAGVVMIIIPSISVFLIGQKQLIHGMFSGAVKG